MGNTDIIGKVASGLRNMKTSPDAFVYNANDVSTWDQRTILGIPVFHIDLITDLILERNKRNYIGRYKDVLFIPVWSTDGIADERLSERMAFAQGYLEWESDKERITNDAT